jgi:hypothetical protein
VGKLKYPGKAEKIKTALTINSEQVKVRKFNVIGDARSICRKDG